MSEISLLDKSPSSGTFTDEWIDTLLDSSRDSAPQATATPAPPSILRLRADNALAVLREIECPPTAGNPPLVIIDDIQGLNPRFVRQLLRYRPDTYLDGRAFFDLERPLSSESAGGFPRAGLLVLMAVTLWLSHWLHALT